MDAGNRGFESAIVPRRLQKALLGAAVVVLAATVSFFSLLLVSPTEVRIGPVLVEFEARPALSGGSVVEFPPVGSLEADTHPTPVELTYTVKEIAVEQAGDLTRAESPAREALRNWRDPVEQQTRTLLIRVFAAALVSAGTVAWLIRRSWSWALAGLIAGMFVAAVLSLLTWATYDTGAFAEPKYTGTLAQARELTDFSQEVLANLDRYGDQVPQIAENLYRTINELQQLPDAAPLEGSLRILHVSDLHASDAGAALLRSAARQYAVAAVIDTGDITELSLPFELDYPESFLPLEVPYIWVSGNHDKDAVRETMRGIDGVTVLDGDFTEVEGLRIAGFPDPSSAGLLPRVSTARELEADSENILARLESNPPLPDIVAVHDPGQASRIYGVVPVVLSGHMHRHAIEIIDGSIAVNAGSTGAGGLRGFEGELETPGSLQVLYFDRDSHELIAVDTIVIYGFSQEFQVSRMVVARHTQEG